VRPKRSTYTFSVAERILLCLKEHHSTRTYEIPPELTQRGISSLLNIRTFNVSRYLIDLTRNGHIQMSMGRPRGGRKRMQYYLLTDSGNQKVLKLLESAAGTKINLVFPSREMISNLYDAPSLVPGNPTLTELITATRNNSVDVASFMGDRARRGGSLRKASPGMPTVEHFYGRTGELDKINEWYRSSTGKILSVVGMAGIGKTVLLARAARDWVQDRNVFWHKIREYDTAWSVAHAASTFLSTVENRLVSGVIAERDLDLGLLSYILAEETKNIEMVFVFDDLHNASEDALTAIRAITDIVVQNKNMKLATASRKEVKIVDRRIYMAEAKLDMKIDGLDPSTAALLLPKGLNRNSGMAEALINKTGGHPLLIKSAMLGIADDFGFHKYIQDEIMSGISKAEGNTLKTLALFRTPVKMGELCNLNISIDDVESLDGRGLIEKDGADNCEIHEVIKEFMVSRMGRDERTSLNKRIARMYSSLPGELFSVESIYHSVDAGDYERGAALLMDFGESIVTYGMAPRIAAQVRKISENYRPVANSAAKYYRILGDVFEQSGDWDVASAMYGKAGGKRDDMQSALALTRLMGIYYRKGQLDAARKTINRAVKIAERSGSVYAIGEAQYSLGSLALELRNISEAQKAFEATRNIARKSGNAKLLAQATYGMGRVEHAQGRLKQAITSKEEAAALFKRANNNVELCKVLTSIGMSYLANGDSKTALEFHENAASLCEKIGSIRHLAYALANAGGVLIKLPNYVDAEKRLTRALKLFEGLNEKSMVSDICLNLSLLYTKNGHMENAIVFAERGQTIAVERGIPAGIARADAFLGKALLESKRYSEAKKYIKSALCYAMKTGNMNLQKEMERDLKFLSTEKN
jgi:tetratricopeptide (TPR) repeat protein